MTDNMARLEVVKFNGEVFVDTMANDVVFYTASSNQSIHIGPFHPNNAAAIKIDSSSATVNGRLNASVAITTPLVSAGLVDAYSCTACNVYGHHAHIKTINTSNVTTHTLEASHLGLETAEVNTLYVLDANLSNVTISSQLSVPVFTATSGNINTVTSANAVLNNGRIQDMECAHAAVSNIICPGDIDCLEEARLNLMYANDGTFKGNVFIGNRLSFARVEGDGAAAPPEATIVVDMTHVSFFNGRSGTKVFGSFDMPVDGNDMAGMVLEITKYPNALIFCGPEGNAPLVLELLLAPLSVAVGTRGKITLIDFATSGRLFSGLPTLSIKDERAVDGFVALSHVNTTVHLEGAFGGYSVDQIDYVVISQTLISATYRNIWVLQGKLPLEHTWFTHVLIGWGLGVGALSDEKSIGLYFRKYANITFPDGGENTFITYFGANGEMTDVIRILNATAATSLSYMGLVRTSSNKANDDVMMSVFTNGKLTLKDLTPKMRFSKAMAIAVHTIVVSVTGEVFTWGANYEGQLGNGSMMDSLHPLDITNMGSLQGKKIIAVSVSENHTIALDSQGKVHTWGGNDDGQIGNGTTLRSLIPINVSGFGSLVGKTIVSVAALRDGSVVLDSQGKVHVWGITYINNGGILLLPTDISEYGSLQGKTIVSVQAGSEHSIVLDNQGKVHTWGNNALGQVGNGNNGNSVIYYAPINVSNYGSLVGKTVVYISAGSRSSVAVDNEGKVHMWGEGFNGKLGNGFTNHSFVPNYISYNGSITEETFIVAVELKANTHTVALDNNGNVHMWGGVNSWQNPGVNSLLPVNVSSTGTLQGKTIVSVTNGWFTTMALDSQGDVHIWGNNMFGQLGDGTLNNALVPQMFELDRPIVRASQIMGVAFHTIVVSTAGEVFSWGENYGKLGNGTNMDSLVPINITSSGSLQGKTIIALAVGDNHNVALDSQGKVHTWGNNSNGQLGNGTTMNSTIPNFVSGFGSLQGKTIVGVSAGLNHSIAVDNNGKVYTWGYNTNGQLGNNTTTGSTLAIDISGYGSLRGITIVSVRAGFDHNVALSSQGKVYTWGTNRYGQLGDGIATSRDITRNVLLPMDISNNGSLIGKTIVAISAGFNNTVVVDNEGKVHTWGYNLTGVLGNGTISDMNSLPSYISYDGSITEETIIISAEANGYDHMVALDNLNRVHIWGNVPEGGWSGPIGVSSSLPVNVSDFGSLQGKTTVYVTNGYYNTMALDSQGNLHLWGENWSGALGDGTFNASEVPRILALDDRTAISNTFTSATGAFIVLDADKHVKEYVSIQPIATDGYRISNTISKYDGSYFGLVELSTGASTLKSSSLVINETVYGTNAIRTLMLFNVAQSLYKWNVAFAKPDNVIYSCLDTNTLGDVYVGSNFTDVGSQFRDSSNIMHPLFDNTLYPGKGGSSIVKISKEGNFIWESIVISSYNNDIDPVHIACLSNGNTAFSSALYKNNFIANNTIVWYDATGVIAHTLNIAPLSYIDDSPEHTLISVFNASGIFHHKVIITNGRSIKNQSDPLTSSTDGGYLTLVSQSSDGTNIGIYNSNGTLATTVLAHSQWNGQICLIKYSEAGMFEWRCIVRADDRYLGPFNSITTLTDNGILLSIGSDPSLAINATLVDANDDTFSFAMGGLVKLTREGTLNTIIS